MVDFTHIHAMTLEKYTKNGRIIMMLAFVKKTLMSPHLSWCCQSINIIKNQHKNKEDRQTHTDMKTDGQRDRQVTMVI